MPNTADRFHIPHSSFITPHSSLYLFNMYTLKKSLGQHFLNDGNILRKIVAALGEDGFDRLLEIGPGGGALTKELLLLPGIDFKAVELDTEKVEYLLRTWPTLQGKLIQQDFLTCTPPWDEPFTVVGNFPYNISTEILFKVLTWKQQVPVVVGMFQKEVAQRVAAQPGSKTYGVISVLLQAYYDIEYLFDVAPGCFTPSPKVMSGVIRLRRRQEVPPMRSEKDFTSLVKTAFNQRRKQLRNAAKSLFDVSTLQESTFERRPETFSVEEFAALTYKMKI
jgi:16S rRNA (adenine1518-N6/adenine1519-N6)-dimethyltransferase